MFLIVIISEQTNLKHRLNLQYNIRLHDKNHNIHRNTTLQCPDNTTPIRHNRTKHNSHCSTSSIYPSETTQHVLNAFLQNSRRHFRTESSHSSLPAWTDNAGSASSRSVCLYTSISRPAYQRRGFLCPYGRMAFNTFFPVARCSRDLRDTRNSSGSPAARQSPYGSAENRGHFLIRWKEGPGCGRSHDHLCQNPLEDLKTTKSVTAKKTLPPFPPMEFFTTRILCSHVISLNKGLSPFSQRQKGQKRSLGMRLRTR